MTQKLKLAVYRLIYAIYSLVRPMPPLTEKDRQLAAEFKAKCSAIPRMDTKNLPSSQQAWAEHMNRFLDLARDNDPREFLRWDVIIQTMTFSIARTSRPLMTYLRGLPDWNSRWAPALVETRIGFPLPAQEYPRSSKGLILQAYSTAQFEGRTGIRLDTLDTIVEFGGGYGCLARFLHNVGFKGKHIIFDLPAFGALQTFYLKSCGIEVCSSLEEFRKRPQGVLCISEIEDLKAACSEYAAGGNSLFVASFSLSETPIVLREQILSIVSLCRSFLFVYQNLFSENNNAEYFSALEKRWPDIRWHHYPVWPAVPSYFLLGARPSPATK